MSILETVDVLKPRPPVFRPRPHYQEWLTRQLGGDRTVIVPDDVVAQVSSELENMAHLQRFKGTRSLANLHHIRRALKNLWLMTYYGQEAQLLQRIFGVRVPHVDPLIQKELIKREQIIRDVGIMAMNCAYLTVKLLCILDPENVHAIQHFANYQGSNVTAYKMLQREAYIHDIFDRLLWPFVPFPVSEHTRCAE